MRNVCHESSLHSGCRAVGALGRQEHQAAQMRAPLCLLLLVAHAVDMLALHRRKKQVLPTAMLPNVTAVCQDNGAGDSIGLYGVIKVFEVFEDYLSIRNISLHT
ncbi:hypothetical protein STEG23_012971 [Scotinomys teguina]